MVSNSLVVDCTKPAPGKAWLVQRADFDGRTRSRRFSFRLADSRRKGHSALDACLCMLPNLQDVNAN